MSDSSFFASPTPSPTEDSLTAKLARRPEGRIARRSASDIVIPNNSCTTVIAAVLAGSRPASNRACSFRPCLAVPECFRRHLHHDLRPYDEEKVNQTSDHDQQRESSQHLVRRVSFLDVLGGEHDTEDGDEHGAHEEDRFHAVPVPEVPPAAEPLASCGRLMHTARLPAWPRSTSMLTLARREPCLYIPHRLEIVLVTLDLVDVFEGAHVRWFRGVDVRPEEEQEYPPTGKSFSRKRKSMHARKSFRMRMKTSVVYSV